MTYLQTAYRQISKGEIQYRRKCEMKFLLNSLEISEKALLFYNKKNKNSGNTLHFNTYEKNVPSKTLIEYPYIILF